MPELVVCTMPLDDEFLLVGDGDIGGLKMVISLLVNTAMQASSHACPIENNGD